MVKIDMIGQSASKLLNRRKFRDWMDMGSVLSTLLKVQSDLIRNIQDISTNFSMESIEQTFNGLR